MLFFSLMEINDAFVCYRGCAIVCNLLSAEIYHDLRKMHILETVPQVKRRLYLYMDCTFFSFKLL